MMSSKTLRQDQVFFFALKQTPLIISARASQWPFPLFFYGGFVIQPSNVSGFSLLYLIFILWVIWPTKLIRVSFDTPNYVKGLQSLESDLRSFQRNGLVSFIGRPWFLRFLTIALKPSVFFQLSVWLICAPFQQKYQFVIGTDTHAHQVFHSFHCVPA